MPIKDTFRYIGRWDSVGLDCSNCLHHKPPESWPDKSKSIMCALHKISLKIELNEKGFKNGEWFCKNFSNNGTASKTGVEDFERIKVDLKENILYRLYTEDGFLKKFPFDQLEKSGEMGDVH